MRIEHLLRAGGPGGRGTVRVERAVRILQYIGTPQAVMLLQELSGGDPASALTRLAGEALARTKAK